MNLSPNSHLPWPPQAFLPPSLSLHPCCLNAQRTLSGPWPASGDQVVSTLVSSIPHRTLVRSDPAPSPGHREIPSLMVFLCTKELPKSPAWLSTHSLPHPDTYSEFLIVQSETLHLPVGPAQSWWDPAKLARLCLPPS